MNKKKPEFSLWGKGNNLGKEIVNIAWTGTKAVGLAVVTGLALGLGLKAFNSASSN